jgi:hypothetical protein
MPKRMTVTEKWNDEWFINLSPQAKVIWQYLLDNCDLAGVCEINLELMRFRIKFSPNVDVMKHLNELNEMAQKIGMEDRVEWFTDNRKCWVKNFIRVQYGVLTQNSSTHRGVLKVINNHALTKGLPKGFETLIGTLKNKVKNKNKVKYNILNTNNTPKELNIPFDAFWNLYDKKRDRDKCEAKWKALSDQERTAAMEFIPKYISATPIKQYRRDPQTFLYNRGWLDEIIVQEEKNDSPKIEQIPTGRKLVKISYD